MLYIPLDKYILDVEQIRVFGNRKVGCSRQNNGPPNCNGPQLLIETMSLWVKFGLAVSWLWKRWEYQTTWPASWETCMQVRKQQLELDMEQQTGSK